MAIAEPTGIRPMEAPRACAMQCAGARARGASPLHAVIITVVSVVLIVFGIILAALSYRYENQDGLLTTDLGSLTDQVKQFR